MAAQTNGTADLGSFLASRPLNKTTILLTLLLSLILIADGFDIVLLAYLAPSIAAEFRLDQFQVGLVLTAAHIGVAAGGVTGGFLGDRFGRRPILIVAVAGFSLGTVLCAVSATAVYFVLARLLASLCMGAAAPVIATYLVDLLPARWTGRLGFMAYTAYAVGSTLCGLTARTFLPQHGWETIFLIGGLVPLLLLPLIFVFLPESPRFLIRRREADVTVPRSLRKLGIRLEDQPESFAQSSDNAQRRVSLAALLRDHRNSFLGFSTLAMLLYFSAIGLTSMGTIILTSAGLEIEQAISALLYNNLAGLAGAAFAAVCIYRLGSKVLLLAILSTSVACLAALAVLSTTGQMPDASIVIALFALTGFGLSSGLMMLYPIAAQAFPAAVRASGTGAVTSIGRIGSIICSAVVAFVLGAFGTGAVFATLGLTVIGCLIAVLYIRRHIPPASAAST
jgi:AAHS family 4-hydroxybenzoate transporter-like MFS transporter